MKELPNWFQAGIAMLMMLVAIIAFGVHLKAGVDQNRDTLRVVHQEVQAIDDLVRENQRVLAQMEVLLHRQGSLSIEPSIEVK